MSLVVSAEDVRLLGYFTLALKPLTVRGETVSNTMKRKLLRISELDEGSDTYTMSAYLVAQLGKNFSESEGKDVIIFRMAHGVGKFLTGGVKGIHLSGWWASLFLRIHPLFRLEYFFLTKYNRA